MGRPESAELAMIDDISAACSAIRESLRFVAIRNRNGMTKADADEYRRIIAATRRIQDYHAELRARLSAEYQKGQPDRVAEDHHWPQNALRLVE